MLVPLMEPGIFHDLKLLCDHDGVRSYLGYTGASGSQLLLRSAPLSEGDGLALLAQAQRLNRLDPRTECRWQSGQALVVRPWYPGPNLTQLWQGQVQPTLDQWLGGFITLFDLLGACHSQGVLHGGIHPGNIITAPYTLVDFLLARPCDARYLAPESLGLLPRVQAGPAADLYSLAVCLYRSLAGHWPWPDGADRLSSPEALESLPIRQQASHIPRVLDELCQRLLAPHPQDRPADAGAVATDLRRIRRALLEQSNPSLRLSPVPRLSRRKVDFVVRWEELQALRELSNQSGVVVLEGVSGSGKSRLLEEFAAEFAAQKRVLQVRLDDTPSSPLAALDMLVQVWLTRPLSGLALDVLRPHTTVLASLFPKLAAVLGQEQADNPLPRQQEYALEALLALLEAMAPALILIDDLHWADSLTRLLIERWHESGRLEPQLVVAVREAHLGDEFSHCPRVKLEPLTAEQTRSLLGAVGGSIDADYGEQIQEATQGNIFLTLELLRGLTEAAEGESAELRTSERTAELLRHRIDSLPPECGRLLSQAAVLGRQFSDEDLSVVSDRSAPLSLLQPALDSQILLRSGSGRLVFMHDRLREHALAGLEVAQQQRTHLALADWLELHSPQDCQRLAYHFGRSNQPQRALPHALAAARQSLARFSLELAESQYRLATSCLTADSGRELTGEIYRGLAEVLLQRGRYSESRQWFMQALQLARPDSQPGLLSRLAYLELSRGQVAAAAQFSEQVLFSLQVHVPRHPLLAIGDAALRLLGHGLRARSRHQRPPVSESQSRRIEAIAQFSFMQFFVHRPDLLIWGHMRALELAERHAPSPVLASAYALHSICLASLGKFESGLDYANRAMAIVVSSDDRPRLGRIYMHRGLSYLLSGRLEQADSDYRDALRLLGRAIDPWDRNVIAQNRIQLALFRGQLAEVCQQAEDLYRLGEEQGDRMARAASLRYWVRACGGRLPVSVVPEIEDTGDKVALLYQHEVSGVYHLCRGELDKALNHLELALRIAVPAMEKCWTVAWWLSACRQHPSRGGSHWKRALEQALKLAQSYPLVRPQVWREAGLRAVHEGRAQQALSWFGRSEQEAERLRMPYELAQTLAARARFQRLLGWSGAETAAEQAQRLFYEVGATWEFVASQRLNPAQLDRYQRVLELGSTMAGLQDPESLFEQLRATAQILLRADRVELLAVGDLKPWMQVALDERRAVLWDARGRDREEVVLGQRSALVSPLWVGDRCQRLLYARHDQWPDYFGPEELKLADLLTGLAASALENLQHRAELQRRESHFRTLFYEAGPAMAVVDRLGAVSDHNSRLEDMVQRVERTALLEWIHPDHRAELEEHLRSWTQARLEVRYLSRAGGWLWGELTFNALDQEQAVVSISDISYRKIRQVVLFAETERRLLSSELHDVISQPLAGLSLLLQAIEGAPDSRRSALLTQASLACSDLVEQLGSLMHGLRVPDLGGARLGRALRELMLQWQHTGGFQIDYSWQGEPGVVAELTAIFLYRIAHESLQNVFRHACARRVSVRIEADANGVAGEVSDDGVGWDGILPIKEGHWGLQGMRERAELLGGRLTVTGAIGKGCKVVFYLPSRSAL